MESEKTVFISPSEVLDFVNNGCKNTTIKVDYFEYCAELIDFAIKAYSILNKNSVILSNELTENGLFKVIEFTGNYIPGLLTEADLSVLNTADYCVQNFSEQQVDFNLKLTTFIIGFAKEKGLKLKIKPDGGFWFIPGKFSTLYSKIEAAHKSGLGIIDFDSEDTSIHTVRAYCSLLKQQTGANVYCRLTGSKIVVYLRDPGEEYQAIIDIKYKIKMMKDRFSESQKQELIDFVNEELSAGIVSTDLGKDSGFPPIKEDLDCHMHELNESIKEQLSNLDNQSSEYDKNDYDFYFDETPDF